MSGSSLTLKDVLARTGRSYCFLMHLSWGKASNEVKRKELWDYATTNGLIGIDCNNPDVNVRWAEFSRGQRAVMSAHWRRHFDLFSAMQIGDCVVVANGVTELLGIGVVKGSYEFNGKLGAFFRHVRRVDWILQHQWGNRLRLPIHYWFQGFQNTIQRIDNNSDYWKITGFRFASGGVRFPLQKATDLKRALKTKYGLRGEGPTHKKLKEWVLANPEKIGLRRVEASHLEYEFLTGDRADIMFDLPKDHYAVVEIETDDLDLIRQGAFQAIKYRTLKCAEIGCNINSNRVRAVLVAQREPEDLAFCRNYDIGFIKCEAA